MVYMPSILFFTTLFIFAQSAPLPSSVQKDPFDGLPQHSAAVSDPQTGQKGLSPTSNSLFIPGPGNFQKDSATFTNDGPGQSLEENGSFRHDLLPSFIVWPPSF